MKELKTKTEELSESVTEYIQTYCKVTVLKTVDKATGIAAFAVSSLTILFLAIFVLFFSGIALSMWLGELMRNIALGYLLVAGIYILIIIILILLRKRVVFPRIRNLIINKLYE